MILCSNALEYIETLLTYIASTTDKITEEDIQKAIEQTDMEEVMPTLVQKWMEKGRMEGRMEGREEGMILDAQEMVMEALMERFGLPDPELSVKIRAVVNRDLLKSLLKLAIRVNSEEEFKEQINKIQ